MESELADLSSAKEEKIPDGQPSTPDTTEKKSASESNSTSVSSAPAVSLWAKTLKLPQVSGEAQGENAAKSTFSRFTSGFGLRFSGAAPVSDGGAPTGTKNAQGGVLESFTKGLVDSSRGAVKAVQVKARHLVSQNKRRYQEGGFDLDLTYITDKIIAMGFPAGDMSSGLFGYVEGFYRNHMEEVIKFLDSRHQGKYKVYNLCSERLYDASLFQGKAASFPFEDHNCPPIHLISSFCHSAYTWLKADIENVVVIHCKAGLGRTGLMISSLLSFLKVCPTAEESIDLFNQKRCVDGKGLVHPSQIRYVKYFERILKDYCGVTPPGRRCMLRGFRLHKCPYWIRPSITISDHSGALEFLFYTFTNFHSLCCCELLPTSIIYCPFQQWKAPIKISVFFLTCFLLKLKCLRISKNEFSFLKSFIIWCLDSCACKLCLIWDLLINSTGVLFTTMKHPKTKDLMPEDFWMSSSKKGMTVFAIPGEPGLTELAGDFKIHFQDRHGDFYCWFNTAMSENRILINSDDLDGFEKRKLPSPTFQLEIVMTDYDGTPKKSNTNIVKTSQDGTPNHPSSSSNKDLPNKEGSSSKREDKDDVSSSSNKDLPNKEGSSSKREDKDDVFSDSDGEKDRPSQTNQTPTVVVGNADNSHASNLTPTYQPMTVSTKPNSKSSDTGTDRVSKAQSGPETPKAVSVPTPDFKAIAADASVFTFGDEDYLSD